MYKQTRWLCLASALILSGPGFSMVNSVAGLANPMENSGASARAQAMGGAFVGVADDSSALFWNPAGLAGLGKMEMALHHNSWLAGIIQETAVLGMPLGALGGVAASLNYVNYGSLPGYDDNGLRVADYSANRYGLGVGWGMRVLRDVSAGASLKGAYRTLGGTGYSDLSLDLGGLWEPRPALKVGLSYSNLGTAVGGFSQASALRVGGSYGMPLSDTNHILFAAAASVEPMGVNRLQAGVEDLIHSMLALRLGYQLNLADNQIGGLIGLTGGLGISYENFGLDYAYLPFGDLGTAQRLTLSYKFGRDS